MYCNLKVSLLITRRSSRLRGSPWLFCKAITFLSWLVAALVRSCWRSKSARPSVASTLYLWPVLAFKFGMNPAKRTVTRISNYSTSATSNETPSVSSRLKNTTRSLARSNWDITNDPKSRLLNVGKKEQSYNLRFSFTKCRERIL